MSTLHGHRIGAIVLRQFYLMRGSPVRVLPMVVWCTIDIILWGFITRYLNTITSAGPSLVPALLGAILFWDFFTRVMHGVATAFLEDVWSRNFLNIFATPLAISEYLAGLILTSIATSLVGLVVMLVLASVIFGLSFFVYGLMRSGPAVRAPCGVVCLAHPCPPLSLCRGLLSALGPASVDAIHLVPPASVLRLRVHACDPCRPTRLPDLNALGRFSGPGVRPAGVLVLYADLSPRRAERPDRPVQCRDGGLGRLCHGFALTGGWEVYNNVIIVE
jgi:hypothetical protein